MARAAFQPPLLREEDYGVHHEVAEVATTLIARHGVTFSHLADFRLLYLGRHGEPPDANGESDESRAHAIARAFKAPPLWRDVSGADGGFWAWRWWWNRMGPQEREALCMHELLHLGIDGKGRLRLEKHDVEEFALVVRTYGTWHSRLQVFAHQLDLFERPDEEPGRPTIVPSGNGSGPVLPPPDLDIIDRLQEGSEPELSESPDAMCDRDGCDHRRGEHLSGDHLVCTKCDCPGFAEPLPF